MTNYPAIVGIDPSLTSTGIAIRTSTGDISTHRVQSKGRKDATWGERLGRLCDLTVKIATYAPHDALVIIESPSYGSPAGAGSQHDRSGLWWSVFEQLDLRDCTVIPATPTQRMKYATGKGNASKDAVLAAAVKRYEGIDITGNDIADAVVLMAMGCRLAGMPIEPSLPIHHLAALDKLSVPKEAA